jgi:hypothetical protein
MMIGFSHPKARYFLLRRQATGMWRMWKMQEHFSTKESIPRKGDPVAAYFLCSSLLTGVAKRDSCPFGNARHPCRAPQGLIRLKAPVLGAANGILCVAA